MRRRSAALYLKQENQHEKQIPHRSLYCVPDPCICAGMKTGGSPADKANVEAMQKMEEDMTKEGSGDPDRDFVTMMMPHHRGAIEMAKTELQYGKDPMLQKMAKSIVGSQEGKSKK
jgi:uncharacterized protein (DUF305 family)